MFSTLAALKSAGRIQVLRRWARLVGRNCQRWHRRPTCDLAVSGASGAWPARTRDAAGDAPESSISQDLAGVIGGRALPGRVGLEQGISDPKFKGDTIWAAA